MFPGPLSLPGYAQETLSGGEISSSLFKLWTALLVPTNDKLSRAAQVDDDDDDDDSVLTQLQQSADSLTVGVYFCYEKCLKLSS